MSDNEGRGYLVGRFGPQRGTPFAAGQLVATFPILDAAPSRQDYPSHGHAHLVDEVGVEEAAALHRELASNARKYGVPVAWADDARAVNAAEILHRSKDRADPCRQMREERISCHCLRGKASGARPLLRSFVADGRKWLVTSSFKIGNEKVGRIRVPPLAEPVPVIGQTHVQNLVAVCEHCLGGLLAEPRVLGEVRLTRLGAPTFGQMTD